MYMDYIDLINNIDNNRINNINLIHVKEEYFVDLAVKSLVNDFLGNDFLDLNYEKIDFKKLDIEIYQNNIETLPFMSDKRIIVIDYIEIEKDSLKKHENILEEIQKSFEDFNDRTYLFLIYRGESLFKGKFVKSIEKNGDIYTFDRLNRDRFINFIKKYFQSHNIRLDTKSAKFISDRLRYLDKDATKNLFEVENELSKLRNNIKSKVPSFDEIEESIIDTFEEKIFGLLDFMSAKDVKKSILAYNTMKNEDQFMIYYMIIRQIRNMISVKDCLNRRLNLQTSREYVGISNFEYGKLENLVRKFTIEELLQIHRLCYESEIMLKTSKRTIEELIERIIYEFCLKFSLN